MAQYYNSYIHSTGAIDIIFSGLVRNQQYHMKCLLQSTHGSSTDRTSTTVTFENFVHANNTAVNIVPPSTISTNCANFQFTADPGTDVRRGIVHYCQKKFSEGGFFQNGCIVCTYTDMSYMAPGLDLAANVTCSSTAAKSRLRFLQTAPMAPAVTAGVPTVVTVCPVQNKLCATDPTKGYSEVFKAFTDDLKTGAKFTALIEGISNAPALNETQPTIPTTDSGNAPDLTSFTINTIVHDQAKGTATWNTGSMNAVLNCKWQIATGAAPSASAVWNCLNDQWCGTTRVTNSAGASGTNPANLKTFATGTTYNIYYVCVNDIPGATALSAIKSVGQFVTATPSPTVSTPEPCPNRTGYFVPDCISSNFISYSIISLLILFGLLF